MSEKNQPPPPLIFGYSDPDDLTGYLGNKIAELFKFHQIEFINLSNEGRHTSNDMCLHEFAEKLLENKFGIVESSKDDYPGNHNISATKQAVQEICIASSALISSYGSPFGTNNKILQYRGGSPQKETVTISSNPINKKRFLESLLPTNLSEIRKFAQTAIKVATANNLDIVLLNSDDGWKSEKKFLEAVAKYLEKIQVKYHLIHGISDNLSRKKSLFVCNFTTGQRAIEMLPFINEAVVCGKIIQTADQCFYYEEARRYAGDDLIKKALPLIIGFAEMIGMANPEEKPRCNVIIHAALDYYFMSRYDSFSGKDPERLTLHRMFAFIETASNDIHF